MQLVIQDSKKWTQYVVKSLMLIQVHKLNSSFICVQPLGSIVWNLVHCLKQSTDSTLIEDGLVWDNIVSVGLHNTNADIGNKNSIKIFEKNVGCFIAGCNCHLLHLAGGRGGSADSAVSGFNCQDHQADLYYFFRGSTRCKGILTEYLEFVGLEWENIVWYVQSCYL